MGIWTPGPGPTAGDDVFVGDATSDIASGGAGNDNLNGGAGDDTLSGGYGNDTLVGGDGSDTAIFSGHQGDYVITTTATGGVVVSGADGVDTLSGIERLQFADASIDVSSAVGEFQVNTATTNNQYLPSIAVLAGGGYVVTWTSFLLDDFGNLTHYGDYAQRYDASGAKAGVETQVNTTTASGDIAGSSLAALADGSYVSIWVTLDQDGSGYGVYLQRFDATGTAIGDETQVNTFTANDQAVPSAAALPDGGYVIVWGSYLQDGDFFGIYGQRYDTSGTKVGGEFQVNTTTTGSQSEPSISALVDGGYVVSWSDSGSNWGIYAQRYDTAGAKVGGQFRVTAPTVTYPAHSSTTALTDGGYLISWDSQDDGSIRGVYAQRYDAGGTAVGGAVQVNTFTAGSQGSPSAAALVDGGYVVTWMSNLQDGSRFGVYLQRFDANGAAIGGEARVNTFAANNQISPSVAALADGGYVITWASNLQDGDGYGIYAQRYDAAGNVVDVTGSVGLTVTGDATSQVLSGAGGNDTLDGGAGNDTLNGGVGDIDTARFWDVRANYTITQNGDGSWQVAHTGFNPANALGRVSDGIDTLFNIEQAQFADQILSLGNNAPVAIADSATTSENTPVTTNVLANDTDVDGNALSVTQIGGQAVTSGQTVTLAGGAQATLNANGTITYAPAVNANGAASFGYTVSDGKGGTASADVGVTIAPVAIPALISVAGVTSLVSVSSAGVQGNFDSTGASISADGRYVAFSSGATNLVAGDTNAGAPDVFVRDLQTGTTTLVSASSAGEQGNSISGLGLSSISADGRYVTFYSDASNLVAGDTNGGRDIFVRDLQTGTTTLVSASSAGVQGNSNSYGPSISADGRYVTFSSVASNLVADDSNGIRDIFVRDLQTGTTTLVSVSSGGQQGNGGSNAPSISADGRCVTFQSYASNLVAGDTNGTYDIFVRDLQTGTTTLVSAASTGDQGNDGSYVPSISADGRYVTFQSDASNLVAGDTNGTQDIFVRDVQTGTTTLVSASSAGVQGDSYSGYSVGHSVSADGRYVTFASNASNLVAGDTNGADDIFVRDLQTGTTTLVSASFAGVQGNGDSGNPSISADGRYVTFYSNANNLVAGDSNNTVDIFVREVRPGFSGMEDGAAISLPINVASAAGDMVEQVVLSGLPSGSVLSEGTSSNGGTTWTFAGALPANLTMTPPANYNGSFTLSVTATTVDGASNATATATQTVTISSVNDAPLALNDAATTSEGTPVTINVLANDTDVDGNALSVTHIDGQAVTSSQTVTLAGGAQATLNANGTITYVPAANANGAASFGYAVSDGQGGTASADVGITIAPVATPASIAFGSSTGVTSLVSAGGASSISADGRYVTFISPLDQVVVRDLQTGVTSLISAGGASSISADGRYVTFGSNASDLVAGYNVGNNIFVRDLQTGTTALVSISSTGEQGNNDSRDPSISGDGRYVTFWSYASNLVAGNTNGRGDIFVRDLQTGTTTLVSASSAGVPGNNESEEPSISSNGRYVTFSSQAANLVANDTNGGLRDIFVRDLQTGATTIVSVSSAGERGNSASVNPSISADGRYVTFSSQAFSLVAGDTNGPVSDIFMRDLQTGTTTLVSASSAGEQGNGGSYQPSISADGRYVAFWSEASNLVAGDANGTSDIFVRDLQTGITTLVSASSAGVQGNGFRYFPSISGDGRYVTFSSNANNLVAGDTNGTYDIFLRDLRPDFSGTEDGGAIRMPITVASAAGDAVQQVVLSGLPLGSVLSDGISSNDGTTWTFAGSPPANLTMMPPANYNGSFTLTVAATTGDGASTATATATQTVTISSVNDALPIAVNDAATTSENAAVTIDVLANDTDVDGDALSVTQIDGQVVPYGQTVTLAGGAQATLNTNGTITYAPAANTNGEASFSYTVSDGQGGTASADIGVTIAPVATPAHIFFGGVTSLVSISSGGEQGNSYSYDPSISADGRYVTFSSNASNLVAGDANGTQDIFVRDLQTGTTTLVSASTASVQGNNYSYHPSISADGRYVTFASQASNLVASDTNGGDVSDIFLRDLQTGTTSLVSVSSAGLQGNLFSQTPSISADGRYVTFTSFASNLVGGDTNGTTDIFVHDLQTGTTTLVSASSASEQGNRYSNYPSISADGRYVAFHSNASNLVAGDTNGVPDIFVRDLQTGTTSLVSASSASVQSNGSGSYLPSISADGRYVAFQSNASNLVAVDSNGVSDIFVRDLQTGTTSLVSATSAGEQGNGGSDLASLSVDGRYVTFRSDASNLVTADANGAPDIFMRDLQTGITTLVSASSAGEQGNGYSYEPSISANGRYVTFASYASNLVAGDTNGTEDIFVRDLRPGFAGIEDGDAILLPITITPAAGETVASLVLSGLPLGSVLSEGTSSNDGTTWTFAGSPSANLTLKPPANYNGSFTLTVTATTVDGASTATATATQTVTVLSVNDEPVVVNDTATTSENTSVTIDVLGNDTDLDGDTLSVTQIDGQAITFGQTVTLAGGAQATLNGNGTITYAPASNANGAVSLSYTVSDGLGGTASANVGVTIAPVATPASIAFGPSTAGTGITSLVSASSAGERGNGASREPSISADGRYVTFSSSASNLVAGDTNRVEDIFVRDLQTGTTTLVSATSAGEQGNGFSLEPSISADGRYVTFTSFASNLVAGDPNGTGDIFVRDLQTGTTTLVSASSAGLQSNSQSYYPSISGDGRYVTFSSQATNLVAGDTSLADIFVRDLQTGTTTLVSASSGSVQGNGGSYRPSITADGRYVMFESRASNLVAGDANGTEDIFVRDLQTGITTLVSVSSGSVQGNGGSQLSSISADGRYVTFYSSASNLVAGDANGTTEDIFVRDLQTGTTTLVSASSAGLQGNGLSFYPSISADGRYVAFRSLASNLVAGDTNGTDDTFVRDLQNGTTTLVSASSAGVQGNGGSYQPSISADGRYVTFSSSASNLVAGDTNGVEDIFVRDLRPGVLGVQDDGPISLPITITPAAGETVASVVLSGLPSGSVLSDGISSNGGTTWTFAGSPPANLTLTPPANYNGSFTLTVTATTVDGASNATATATQTVTILPETVAPTALITDDIAGVATGNVTYQVAFSEAVTGLAADDITVTNGSVVSVSGSGQSYSVTVAPAADFEGSLALSLNAAAVRDKSGNANAAVNADAQLVDTRKPVVTTITPAADSTGVLVAANISLTYSETVRAGAGVIELRTAAGTLVESFNVATSNRLTFAGSTITIDPTASLGGATQYRLTVPQGAVLDAVGNAAAALATYAFTTQSLVNIINGTSVANTLNGTAEDDEIYGFGGNDTLNGNAGNDLLDGGSGADRMTGGAGDDIYVVDNASDVVTEAVNGGIDLIRTNRATYTLASNFENLAFIGDTNFTGTGNAAANSITGGIGNDLLDGRGGNDIMAGGAGNDQYVVDSVGDVIVELASQGIDVVTSSVSYTLSANIENLTLSGSAGLSGTGNASANQITGNSGANTLRGAGGADALNGGGGTDTAVFDQAAASYALDHSGSAVIVSDLVGGEGTDTLTSIETLSFAGASYAIVAGTGTANTLNGGAGSQAIFGLGGNDTINGGAGNDIIIAGLGNDAITLASDTGGRDFIDGGAGEDTFTLATAAGAEAFVIYTRAAALQTVAGLVLNPNTEIVITRNGLVVAELDNIEEIVVSSLRVTSPAGANGGTVSGDTIQVVGDFTQTSLNFNTITINGTQANDVVDISALESAHRIVFTSNGGQDTVIGSLRPQDIVNMGPAASSSAARDGNGGFNRGALAGDAIEVSGDFRMFAMSDGIEAMMGMRSSLRELVPAASSSAANDGHGVVNTGLIAGDAIAVSGDFLAFGMSDGIEAMTGVPTDLRELAIADPRDEGFGRTIIGMEDLLLDLVDAGPVASVDIAMPILIDTDSFFDHRPVLTDYPVS